MLMIEPNIEADNPLVTQISLVDNISQPAARLLKEPIPLIGSGAHCMGPALRISFDDISLCNYRIIFKIL